VAAAACGRRPASPVPGTTFLLAAAGRLSRAGRWGSFGDVAVFFLTGGRNSRGRRAAEQPAHRGRGPPPLRQDRQAPAPAGQPARGLDFQVVGGGQPAGPGRRIRIISSSARLLEPDLGPGRAQDRRRGLLGIPPVAAGRGVLDGGAVPGLDRRRPVHQELRGRDLERMVSAVRQRGARARQPDPEHCPAASGGDGRQAGSGLRASTRQRRPVDRRSLLWLSARRCRACSTRMAWLSGRRVLPR
jgi:hypothetical protein